jgi:hypothetical protein
METAILDDVKKTVLRKPGVRVDAGQRINLKDLKARREAARRAAKAAPPIEDTRVADVWLRQEARDRAAARKALEDRRVRRLQSTDGGKEGAKTTAVKVRVSSIRTDRAIMRCRPGTFEWRYGRNKQGVEFHAGNHLAILWERAGMTIASSADFLRGTASGYPTGISDGRVAALDKLDGFKRRLGTAGAERMIDYCVSGLTTAEIAAKKYLEERTMNQVLRNDLWEVAAFFNFLPKRRLDRRTRNDRSATETS